MKLYDVEVPKLIAAVDKAKGNVFLKTDDGNVLNLKSKLCQLYGIRALLENAKDSSVTADLSVDNPEDEFMFINFMMQK